MNIVAAIVAAGIGLGGAMGASALLEGRPPAPPVSPSKPAPKPRSPDAGSLDAFVVSQRKVLQASLARSADDGLPSPDLRIGAEGCVITLEVRTWLWRDDFEDSVRKARRQAMQRLAAALGEEAAGEMPQEPEFSLPGAGSGRQRLLSHSFERFDLRFLDFGNIAMGEQDGRPAGIVKALPHSGGLDPTNLALAEAQAAQAATPEAAEKIRRFAKVGRIAFNLPFGDGGDARWQHTAETLSVLKRAAMEDGRVTNILVSSVSMEREDGGFDLLTGNVQQPKQYPVFAATSEELRTALQGLRAYRKAHCE